MMDHLRRGAFISLLCFAMLAPAASAGLSTWTSLSGLTKANKASWVRLFASGNPLTTIYAGTEGNGVYKSTDNGLTWSPFNTKLPKGTSVRAFYTSGGQVFAGTDGGLFSAPDSPASGGSWAPVAQGAETDPQHPTKLNQAVQALISLTLGPTLAGTASEGVFMSSDDGQTWTPPAPNNGMPPATTVWSFASFANFVWAATSNGIYRSSDQGSTWTLASDGIPASATTLGIFQDSQNPLIYYAETASDGMYRSVDGATTWQSVNGDPNGEPFGGSSTPTIHSIVELSGATQSRLYTATSDGLWVGTLSNVPGPGGVGLDAPTDITWRQVTQSGLGSNTIMWGLASLPNVIGTLLAGTQSNGGYSLTFEPPSNDGQTQNLPSWLAASILPLNVGVDLFGTSGTWNGTPKIDYSYQWQRCTSTQANSCSDIDKADHRGYVLKSADQGKYIRVVVAATNDFPTPGPLAPTATSVIGGPVGAKPGPLPGDNQQSAPEAVDISPGADPSLPTEGDTLSAPPQSVAYPGGWLFNPPADKGVSYKWLRCDANGDNCHELAGATSQNYILTAADDALTLRVEVTGLNANGETTLPLSGPTNQIIPLPAAQTSPPTLDGNPYVGSSLVGGVGTWASPATYWTRQWEQCQSDGSDCSPIQGETSPEYQIRPDDLGMTLRMHVIADVNPSFQLPNAVDAYTPLSAVVTNPPGSPPPPPTTTTTPTPPTTTTTTTPSPTPAPPLNPPPPPALSGLKLTHNRHGASVAFSLSAGGSVTVVLQRASKGHRSHGRCVSGKRRHTRSCTAYKTVLRIKRSGLGAGHVSIGLPTKVHGRRLPGGHYRLTVTPISTTGHAGASRTISLVH